MPDPEPMRVSPEEFCHVEKHEEHGRTRLFVVHTHAPRFVVEMEPGGAPGSPGVIKRVCVPNSWTGDYHRCGRLLGAAVAFSESPPREAAPRRR